jgi:hypothetical protein
MYDSPWSQTSAAIDDSDMGIVHVVDAKTQCI